MESEEEEEEEEEVEEEDDGDNVLMGRNNSGFRISGQKIQIYSDGSVTVDNRNTVYSLSESEEEEEAEYSDKESCCSNNYDADCSVVESPRIPDPHLDCTYQAAAADCTAGRLEEAMQRLHIDLGEEESPGGPAPGSCSNEATRRDGPRPGRASSSSSDGVAKAALSRQASQESQLTARSSRSLKGSRDSLNLFSSVDFKNLGISKNFSTEIIQVSN